MFSDDEIAFIWERYGGLAVAVLVIASLLGWVAIFILAFAIFR